jgi:hypothetical protein
VWIKIGVPASSVNCLEGCGFLLFESIALGTGAIRVPSHAAGIMTTTFMAGGSIRALAPEFKYSGFPRSTGRNLEVNLSPRL